jgi:integrase
MARQQRPHKCSWNDKLIPGLYRCPDGRWRINATKVKFTEPDERKAVAHFLSLQPPEPTMGLTIAETAVEDIGESIAKAGKREFVIVATRSAREKVKVQRVVTTTEFWTQVREELTLRLDNAAKMTGITGLLRLKYNEIPAPAIKVSEIIKTYQEQNPSTPRAKTRCVAIFNRLIDFTGAKVLDDLTQDRLTDFRKSIEQSKKIESAGTKVWMYGQIKAILSFGLKCGLDQQQIRAALDRCKVLWTPDALPPVCPKPISVEHFHKLLTAAGDGHWRAWLLMGLNAALYLEELCSLRWADVDLHRGVYMTIRNKTKRERVPRAATLWPETIAALRSLKKGPEYVFTSPHGTRYASSNARANAFADLRKRSGVPDTVSFAALKDAAYGIACQSAPDERLARVLAGHRAPGLQDNYVLRHPEIVRPVCDAVRLAYGIGPA